MKFIGFDMIEYLEDATLKERIKIVFTISFLMILLCVLCFLMAVLERKWNLMLESGKCLLVAFLLLIVWNCYPIFDDTVTTKEEYILLAERRKWINENIKWPHFTLSLSPGDYMILLFRKTDAMAYKLRWV